MIGAIFGDIAGSIYELDNIKTKEFELFFRGCEFTDDTVMTVAVADALLRYEEICDVEDFKRTLAKVMREYGRRYPYVGYGGLFSWWLRSEDEGPYNSFGNGSAMRVAPVAWYARSLDEALSLAKATAEITHSHPEGICGAQVTAGAAYLARTGASKADIRAFICQYYDMDFTLDEIRPYYNFDETCSGTVPYAMQAFLESDSFEDAIRNGISLGGDSDTLCAITGAVAEAYYSMTEEEKGRALSYLDDPLRYAVALFRNAVDA
jgi:type I restriction enzyme M protein